MEEFYGRWFLYPILEQVDNGNINETMAEDIATHLGGRVYGHFRHNGKTYGRSKFKDMLSYHYKSSVLTEEAAREKIIKILKDPDINQIRLAAQLEKICSETSTPSNPAPPSVTTQPGRASLTTPSKLASPSVTNQPGTASSSTTFHFYESVQNFTNQGGSNNQLTVSVDQKSTHHHLQNIENNHPEFYEKFVQKLTNGQKHHLQKLISPLQNKLAIPKVKTLLESVSLLSIPGPAGGYLGTAFLVKIKGIPGVVLLSAGHNMYEEIETGCTYFKDGKCKDKDDCKDHGFYSLDYGKFTLFFKNYEGITTATNNPPRPPQFTLQQLIDMFPKHKMSMAYRNIMREDRPGKPPSYTKPNSRNKEEDWFAMVMFDDDDGTTAESKLSRVGLTSLLEVGSSLEQDEGKILFIFGYPGIQEAGCYPLRFHFGNEQKITGGSDDRIYYAFSTFPGNSGSPVLCWQDAEPNFFVKAIHIAADPKENVNKAQRLTNILTELKSSK